MVTEKFQHPNGFSPLRGSRLSMHHWWRHGGDCGMDLSSLTRSSSKMLFVSYLWRFCQSCMQSEKILNGTVNWFVEGSQQKYKILAEKLVAVPSFICGKPALTRRRIPKAMTTGEQRACLMRMWKQAFNEHWSKIQTQWMHLVSGVPKNTAAKIRP